MSDYDDPPEPTDEELDQAATEQGVRANSAIRLEGLTAQDVHTVIAAYLDSRYRIEERFNEALEKRIGKLAESLVTDELKGLVTTRIGATIDAVIATGIPTFDRYSGQVTSRSSIAELVDKELGAKDSDGYGRPTQSKAEKAVAAAVAAVFEGDLKQELEKVRARFKAEADEVLKTKFAAIMREALGLRS